ncbi:MAG: transposase family protein [Ferruginibacter sp.]|nr:transposase family protein [Ferruginibacter sp.]
MELPFSTPSHDTFNRVFSLIESVELQKYFISWVRSIAKITDGQIISTDNTRM